MEHIKERLNEIEAEIQELKVKEKELRERWLTEKSIIKKIQDLKAEIENIKNLAETYEREGNLEKVAEIRYGKLYKLQQELKETTENLQSLQSTGSMLKEEVTEEEIAEVLSKWTGIPVSKMLETERMKIVKMEERLHQRVIGQDIAVERVSNSIRRSRAGLQDPARPIGSFLFIGPTGVGKTELARSLAEFLFDNENSVIRIDMSEYMEKFSVSRLIGAPPGYVGYEEGGQLTEAVRRHPYSVVLLDEIEKANIEVFNILLQVLDDGRLTDGKGRTVNFRNTIIIMTSNIGTDIIQDRFSKVSENNYDTIYPEVQKEINTLLQRHFRPEFINRIDEVVLFKPLTKSEIAQIAKIHLNKLVDSLSKNNISLTYTNKVLDAISEIGYDPIFGARPLKRAIQKHITDSLAKQILEGKFAPGQTIVLDVNDFGNFSFNTK
ncbi:MAG: AAA family ATPase [Flavobacterium piscis]|jgi:ATP-dependent Clp protease ATP-binding subunit ClpB|nr:AAA family ATPase [Flavobacterium piscis]